MRIDHENEARLRVIEQAIASLIAELPDPTKETVLANLKGRLALRQNEIHEALNRPTTMSYQTRVVHQSAPEGQERADLQSEYRETEKKLLAFIDLVGQ